MSSWAGFTDEELNRLRQHGGEEGKTPQESLKKAGLTTGKRQRPREKIRSREQKPSLVRNKENRAEENNPVPSGDRNASEAVNKVETTSRINSREEERENSSPECERRGKNKQGKEAAVMLEEAPSTRKQHATKAAHEDLIQAGDQNGRGNTEKDTEKDLELADELPDIIDESERIQAIELSALEKMQEKQKLIEEENKKKKAALQEAIKQRYKRTQAETHTLALVQKELSHLDSLLSADVAILRDKIEESSREYLHAQKRYEMAEKEFIASKMDLHRKTERKDLLTEHLYTIIRENELRKAKKLEELMARLNVSDEMLLVDQTTVPQAEKNDTVIQEENNEHASLEETTKNIQTPEVTSETSNNRVDSKVELSTTDEQTNPELPTRTDVTVTLQGNETVTI